MKILIVEDHNEIAVILQMLLTEEGYEVQIAGNGKEGYFAYLLFEPDLVITDIQMPERTGIELMQLIRLHNPQIKNIYMSGDLRSYLELLEKEKEVYHVHLLEKPFSRDELLKSLAECSGSGEIANSNSVMEWSHA